MFKVGASISDDEDEGVKPAIGEDEDSDEDEDENKIKILVSVIEMSLMLLGFRSLFINYNISILCNEESVMQMLKLIDSCMDDDRYIF
jgi:hypothetical protein